jgi:hypothetical protein
MIQALVNHAQAHHITNRDHQTISHIFNFFFISRIFFDKNYPIVIAGFSLFCSNARSILF